MNQNPIGVASSLVRESKVLIYIYITLWTNEMLPRRSRISRRSPRSFCSTSEEREDRPKQQSKAKPVRSLLPVAIRRSRGLGRFLPSLSSLGHRSSSLPHDISPRPALPRGRLTSCLIEMLMIPPNTCFMRTISRLELDYHEG